MAQDSVGWQCRECIALCRRLVPLGSPRWQTLHTSLSATRPLPHWQGNGGTQHESPVTAFLPAHTIAMENKEGQLWNAVWTGAWR